MKFAKKLRGFSLIEVSVVIIIVGIFVAGVAVSNSLVSKSRLVAAESLSKSSPINGIKDNILWLETSLASSLNPSQASDGQSISFWNNQSQSAQGVNIAVVGNGPVYSNSINKVHAIKFSGSAADYLQISNAEFLNNTDYTFVILEKRQSDSANNYFIGEASSGPNSGLALGYSSDSTITHSQGNQSYTSTITPYANSKENARLFTFTHSSVSGNKTYINGVLAAEDATKTAHLSGIATLAIGKGYTGEIGEIAVFTRSLSSSEISAVEDYYSQKWSRKLYRGNSCAGYTVTDNGCDMSSASCSISVAGFVASVPPASSLTSRSCNQQNYSGSISYTCINGNSSVTGSCSCAAGYTGSGCSSCATGYTADVNGICQQNCSANNITGITNGTSFTYTSTPTLLTCNSGFAGPAYYTCIGGNLSITSGACSPIQACDGGSVSQSGGRTIHTFTTSSSPKTLTCSITKTAKVLVVGGGGSGGCAAAAGGGGGGGGGGVVYSDAYSLTATTYNITIGAGGAGVNNASGAYGNNGGDSSFGTMTAKGGGGGGYFSSAGSTLNGKAGGSSGGAGGGVSTLSGVASNQTAQTGQTNHYGNSGGGASANNPGYSAGGGGGAGSAGFSAANSGNGAGGAGGTGISISITGSSVIYGAGGGGSNGAGNSTSVPGSGGSGAGGNAGNGISPTTAGSAGAFSATGTAGNGGGGSRAAASGAGSDGIVIISY